MPTLTWKPYTALDFVLIYRSSDSAAYRFTRPVQIIMCFFAKMLYLNSTLKALFMIHLTISRIAIWLLAMVMVIFGIIHFTNPNEMLNYVPLYLPKGIMWVYLVGVAFIFTALAFFTNRFVSVAGYLLCGLLIAFVLLIHIPNHLHSGDPLMRQMALVNALKDTAIAGFAMYIASIARHQRLKESNP